MSATIRIGARRPEVTPAPSTERTPTGEQQAAIDAFRTGEPLVLEAGAGTGKTTTLRMMAAARPAAQGVYVAYNRAIADDARASFPSNVRCATAHSFAFRDVGRRFKHRLNGARQTAAQAADILGVKEALEIAPKRFLRRSEVARLALDTVAAFCNSADREPDTQHVPFVNGAEHVDELKRVTVELARQAWADLSSLDGRLRFTHDCYLKLWALSGPRLACDFLLLDEAQDANPVIADVVLRQDAQLVAVGDQCQAIYGWRGAVDAMRDWPARLRLPLAQSFRFGDAIAMEANRWLSRLDAPLRLRGLGSVPSVVAPVERADAVLCRTNAGAIGEALQAMGAGERPAIVGGTGEMRRLARAAADLKAGRRTDHRDLCAFESWADVQDHVQEDAAASDLRVLVSLVDSYGVGTILRVADQAVDERDADVVISTAHKAKGREWPSVRIGSDFRAVRDGEAPERSELMLAYVAVTRARLQLDCGSLQAVEPRQA
jgi:superfamily I DNA/RNA helicase